VFVTTRKRGDETRRTVLLSILRLVQDTAFRMWRVVYNIFSTVCM